MRRVFFCAALLVCAALCSPLDDARGAQTASDELSNELMQKMMALEADTNKKKAPILVDRNKHLSTVDGFWARALENHPGNGNWIFGQDREILKHVTDIAIEEIEPEHHHFKIVLTLKGNTFIANEKLWRTVTGQEDESTGTIDWVGDSKPTGLSFFSYFDSKADPALDPQTISDITHVLRYELYQNPFTFYDLPTIDELASQQIDDDAGAYEDQQPADDSASEEQPAEEAPATESSEQ